LDLAEQLGKVVALSKTLGAHMFPDQGSGRPLSRAGRIATAPHARLGPRRRPGARRFSPGVAPHADTEGKCVRFIVCIRPVKATRGMSMMGLRLSQKD
jgi:hypothetical protein